MPKPQGPKYVVPGVGLNAAGVNGGPWFCSKLNPKDAVDGDGSRYVILWWEGTGEMAFLYDNGKTEPYDLPTYRMVERLKSGDWEEIDQCPWDRHRK